MTKRAILLLLTIYKSLYPKEIQKKLGIRRNTTLMPHLESLMESGEIILNSHGKCEYWEILTKEDYEILPQPPPLPTVYPKFSAKSYLINIKKELRKTIKE